MKKIILITFILAYGSQNQAALPAAAGLGAGLLLGKAVNSTEWDGTLCSLKCGAQQGVLSLYGLAIAKKTICKDEPDFSNFLLIMSITTTGILLHEMCRRHDDACEKQRIYDAQVRERLQTNIKKHRTQGGRSGTSMAADTMSANAFIDHY